MAVTSCGVRATVLLSPSALSLRSSRLAPLLLRRLTLRYPNAHCHYTRLSCSNPRWLSHSTRLQSAGQTPHTPSESKLEPDTTTSSPGHRRKETAGGKFNLYGDNWEDTVDFAIQSFEELPHRLFGVNQHMIINYELKEALRIMLRSFNAPIVYCFAYGSGVFPQENSSRSISEAEFRAVHPKPPEALVKAQRGSPKMIDFLFGVTHPEHWHSINMKQHRDHYSNIASLGSGAVTRVQNWGAGVYFNPYVEVNGMLIKYGVTSINNLVSDLSTWDNLYLAGRLQKPVKILRDHPQVRLANQRNLIAAIRTALLLLPPDFTESDLYTIIAGLSYLGDPRMALPTENKSKVTNIVSNNMVHFRRLYAPLLRTLPNVNFVDSVRLDDENWILNPEANTRLQQDMDLVKRGNMVRRLPNHFRSRLYHHYKKKFRLPEEEFKAMMKAADDDSSAKRQGGEFERRIAADDAESLRMLTRQVIKQTVNWPSSVQSVKGLLMGGVGRSYRYLGEKMANWKKGRKGPSAAEQTPSQQQRTQQTHSNESQHPPTKEKSQDKAD